MDWLADNWGWVVFAVLMLAMHMFGHGGHGSHGRHRDTDNGEDAPARDAPARRPRAGRQPHQH